MLRCPFAWQGLWDVPASVGFLCNKAAMFRNTIQWTPCIMQHLEKVLFIADMSRNHQRQDRKAVAPVGVVLVIITVVVVVVKKSEWFHYGP